MNNWLQNFAYKIELSFVIYLITGIFIATIIYVTVALGSWKIAGKNPAEALRDELKNLLIRHMTCEIQLDKNQLHFYFFGPHIGLK